MRTLRERWLTYTEDKDGLYHIAFLNASFAGVDEYGALLFSLCHDQHPEPLSLVVDLNQHPMPLGYFLNQTLDLIKRFPQIRIAILVRSEEIRLIEVFFQLSRLDSTRIHYFNCDKRQAAVAWLKDSASVTKL
jgi:hypothetical protein